MTSLPCLVAWNGYWDFKTWKRLENELGAGASPSVMGRLLTFRI